MSDEQQATETQAQTDGIPAATTELVAEAVAWPEGLPETYKTDTGVDLEKLATDYKELAALKAEIEGKRAAVPEKPEDYALEFDEALKAPDGTAFSIDDNDPLVPAARAWAKENGLTQDQFKSLVKTYGEAYIQGEINAEKLVTAEAETRRVAELAALGKDATSRLDAVKNWVIAQTGDNAEALLNGLGSSKAIKAVETIMAAMRQAAPQTAIEKQGEQKSAAATLYPTDPFKR